MTREEVKFLQENKKDIIAEITKFNEAIKKTVLESDKTYIAIHDTVTTKFIRIIYDHFRNKGFIINTQDCTISWA